jgi:hypothetical protein
MVHCMAQVSRCIRLLIPVALDGLFTVLQFDFEGSDLDVFFAQLLLQFLIFSDETVIMPFESLALALGIEFLLEGLFFHVLDDFQLLL